MTSTALPTPTGGWNARDDYASMPANEAVELINWIPRPGYLETRSGTDSGDAVFSGDFGTAYTYKSTFRNVMILSVGDYLFSWTGAATGNIIHTGTTTSGATYWTGAQFQNKAIMCLGDGTNAAQVVTDTGSAVSAVDLNVTGVANTALRGVNIFKGRAYYWEAAGQHFWYAAAGAFQGALTKFPLDTVLTNGGALQMMVSISVDGGGGKDDFAAFIFSTGEVLLYQGDDPGDAAGWDLVGSFEIGPPVDPHAFTKLAGTVLVGTRDGVVDLLQAFQAGRFGESAEFTRKITRAATEAATSYQANGGWQIVHHPAGNMVIINIPTGSGNYEQHIRMTDTGAWWKCTGWNGRFTVFDDDLYMVADDSGVSVIKCFTGTKDDFKTEDEDKAVSTTAFSAFTTLRRPELRKHLLTIKIHSNYGTNTSMQVTGRDDFDVSIPTQPAHSSGSSASRTSPFISIVAEGFYIAYVLQTRELDQVIQFNAASGTLEFGGPV